MLKYELKPRSSLAYGLGKTPGRLGDGTRGRMPENAYREDLAYIHDVGHGALAEAAAQRLVEELRGAGILDGVVVDLGCGGGVLARSVSQAGYRVIGMDISEAMVAIARERAPESEFYVQSFVSADLPACIAVTAIGEVLNYAFDERNGTQAGRDLFRRAYEALAPGGLLMLDVAGSERAAAGSHRTFVEGSDWAVLVESELDATRPVLTRRITSFRQVGRLYRREAEIHRLILVDPDELLQSLRSVGFQAQRITGYGVEPLPRGLAGFLARKPVPDAA
jgi:SAM-dependent methyltransferase